MRTDLLPRIILITALFLALDLYVFKGVRMLTANISMAWLRTALHVLYWAVSIGMIVGGMAMMAGMSAYREKVDYSFYFYFFGIMLLVTLPKLVFLIFHLVEDLAFLSAKGVTAVATDGEQISRFTFLSQMGMVLAAVPLVGVAYGILKGRFAFRVVRQEMVFDNLPQAFDGLKIAQISDLHLGSFFNNYSAVQKGIDLLNAQKPDLIFFTGDLVNNYASETDGWVPLFRQLEARLGKYSILGNHDYGDYVAWPDAASKHKNLENVIQANKDMGFRILMNERDDLEIDGEKIGILGVENYGKPPFPQHGDLNKSLQGSEDLPFKILLSHDPSHWDLQVLGQTNIDLTLSGHTHGMQFGVEIGSIKWSPVKMRYPRWGGLYTEGKQHLYVNRGFGYIGFPGRVGMPPEITLIELRSGKTS